MFTLLAWSWRLELYRTRSAASAIRHRRAAGIKSSQVNKRRPMRNYMPGSGSIKNAENTKQRTKRVLIQYCRVFQLHSQFWSNNFYFFKLTFKHLLFNWALILSISICHNAVCLHLLVQCRKKIANYWHCHPTARNNTQTLKKQVGPSSIYNKVRHCVCNLYTFMYSLWMQTELARLSQPSLEIVDHFGDGVTVCFQKSVREFARDICF